MKKLKGLKKAIIKSLFHQNKYFTGQEILNLEPRVQFLFPGADS
jgi:hypothetical protein